MSPRKLTEDDKHEILTLYRNSEATTSTLASDYEVSSSTISRFLKNKLSSVEYEDLIQQKRLARTPRGEKPAEITTETSKKPTASKKAKAKSSPKKTSVKDKVTKTKTAKTKTARKKSVKAVAGIKSQQATREVPVQLEIEAEIALESKPEPQATRRRRRRSSSTADISNLETNLEVPPSIEQEELVEAIAEKSPSKLVIDRQPGGNSNPTTDSLEESDLPKANSLILKTDRIDLDEEEDEADGDVDLVALKEMLGDDVEDFNDDLEDEDEWDEDEDEDIDFSPQDSALHNIEILPLSQALMPKTCYLVIDRSAELIVKPLADFADLGDIPTEEVKQRTLPIFDNHRIAKRFSHRRERVIKVPDGRMIQKTSHHLENKGITRLLIDGQIYSLAH